MVFAVEVPAKCILTGEHVIIQRGFAVVTPFNQYHLTLKYTPDPVKTINTISAEGFNSLQIIFWPVLRRALELSGENPAKLTGYFDIENTIPLGSGLGFSAALCLSVSKWACYFGLIHEENIFTFATQLEDIFHVKSSGVDIAGVMSKGIVFYSADHQINPIFQKWRPNLYISGSGEKSITEKCCNRINKMRQESPEKVDKTDEKMIVASLMAKYALESHESQGISLLTEALKLGNECFYEWDLVSQKLHEHLKILKEHALACKIIGAGYGGYVLSLWDERPTTNLPFKLYPLFRC